MKKYLVLALVLASTPFTVSADELSYSYVEAGYARADWLDANGDGFFGKASAAFGESFYGNVSYQEVTNDDAGFDVTLDETVLGFGYRYAFSDRVDLNVEASYLNFGAGADGFGSDDSDGYRVAVGVRGMLGENFEGNLKGYYSELSELDGGEFGTQIGAVVYMNKTWGIVGSFDHTKLFEESINTWHLGLRASFR